MKVDKSILSAIFGSVSLLAVGIFVYMVLLPGIAFLIISGTASHDFAFDGPKNAYCILTLSVAGGFTGWAIYQMRRKF